MLRSKQTPVVFAARRWTSANAHAKLPAARAWRIVAQPASKYAADAPGVVAGVVPAAPAGCLDGAYPVRVRLTDPVGRTPDGTVLLVEHDGWHLTETGPEWRIELVEAGTDDALRFAFTVECVSDLAEAGQVNRPLEPAQKLLWDSGVVGAGAVIQSPVLDFAGLRALAAIADNSGGVVARDLSIQVYAPDGVTPIGGPVTLGKVMPAMRADALVGVQMLALQAEWRVLYDQVSGLNAALDSLPLNTDGLDSLLVKALASAGTTALSPTEVLDDGTEGPALATLAAALAQVLSWTPGAAAGTGAAASQMAIGAPVPRRARFRTTAAGAGNTVRLIVAGRGRLPGQMRWQAILGARGQVTLAAAGALAARLTIIGS